MPKMKTHSGAKKRFKVSAGGKVKHRCSGKNHIMGKMSQKRKRQLRHDRFLSEGDANKVKLMLVQV